MENQSYYDGIPEEIKVLTPEQRDEEIRKIEEEKNNQ